LVPQNATTINVLKPIQTKSTINNTTYSKNTLLGQSSLEEYEEFNGV